MQLQSGQNIALSQHSLRISLEYPKTAAFGSEIDATAFILSAQNKVSGDEDFIFLISRRHQTVA